MRGGVGVSWWGSVGGGGGLGEVWRPWGVRGCAGGCAVGVEARRLPPFPPPGPPTPPGPRVHSKTALGRSSVTVVIFTAELRQVPTHAVRQAPQRRPGMRTACQRVALLRVCGPPAPARSRVATGTGARLCRTTADALVASSSSRMRRRWGGGVGGGGLELVGMRDGDDDRHDASTIRRMACAGESSLTVRWRCAASGRPTTWCPAPRGLSRSHQAGHK
jgi:hypothetical protein